MAKTELEKYILDGVLKEKQKMTILRAYFNAFLKFHKEKKNEEDILHYSKLVEQCEKNKGEKKDLENHILNNVFECKRELIKVKKKVFDFFKIARKNNEEKEVLFYSKLLLQIERKEKEYFSRLGWLDSY